MNTPIKIRDTVALLLAVVLGAAALGEGVAADLQLPAARLLVAECQGFEALASSGADPAARKLTCNADLVMAEPATSFAQAKSGAVDGRSRT